MSETFIQISGARENNLKNISLKIPKNKITIFTGVSGSGKSSIVFDTIAQEAGRQLNETFPAFARMFMPKYSQPEADEIKNLSTVVAIDQSRLGGNARSTLGTITDINPLFRVLFSRYGEPNIGGYANKFSFNDPSGMCGTCEGIGRTVALDLDAALDMEKSLNEGAIRLPGYGIGSFYWKFYINHGNLDNDKKIKDYSKEEFHRLVYAEAEKHLVSIEDNDINATYEGISVRFARQNINTSREKSEASVKKLEKLTKSVLCPTCEGNRYSKEALSSKINGYNIFDLTDMQLCELIDVLNTFEQNPVIESIKTRVQGIIDIGLSYVTLTRETSSLSGGESQRVKMVKHLSSALTDICYIFDEPSIGLHARDVHRLNDLLIKLRDKGNTVIVVEHDPDVIKIADHVVDIGPKAGANGGLVVFEGKYDELIKAKTLTGEYIGKAMEINQNPKVTSEFYESKRSSLHNLKDIKLKVPKGILTVVTGVAGSGKSTLVNMVFAKEYKEAVKIDQNPVGANVRSNSATYTGVMDKIRQLFAAANNAPVGLFSYNSDGACEKCKGIGSLEINLSFMDNITVVCDECGGKRYKKEALGFKLRGKNIVEIMEMTITEAIEFFDEKDIRNKLKEVSDVGLSYMTLGQPLSTLSGGECQRLKLAKELTKKSGIYILDEPTTGLHMSDVKVIVDIMKRMVQRGNTVLVIEHNFDVMRSADWIIDIGPDGGSSGGQIMYEGPPAGLKKCKESITGRYI